MKTLLKYMALAGGFFLLAGFNSDKGKYYEIAKNLEIFTNLYKEVNTYYVDDLDPSELMRKGIDAMLASLDPYTNYISETDIESYRYYTEGRYHGIGAEVEDARDRLLVVSVVKDGPADKAGIKPGDIVLAVDGQDAKGKKADDLLPMFQGVPGTSFTLTVQKPSGSEQTVTITREDVNVDNVPYFGMITDDIGYVSLSIFSRGAAANVKKSFKELKTQHPNLKGLVLDLRGNGGGLLAEAVDIVNIFIPANQVVVTTKGKVVEWDKVFATRGNPTDTEIPLVILTDKNTASASEIVSGSIQDLDRGVIIGQRTYGKGLVQNTKDLGYNSKIKLTTAKYYIPSKRCIQSIRYDDNGEPVEIPDEERAIFYTKNGRPVKDGGGIDPDIKLPAPDKAPIVKALKDQFVFVDFVTDLLQHGLTVDSVETYHFNGFDKFKAFLRARHFHYDTESEKLLKDLEDKAAAEHLDFADRIRAMRADIERHKEQELEANKAVIISEIEKEVAARFKYQEGRVRISLRNDPEVKEAIQVLKDPQRYRNILHP